MLTFFSAHEPKFYSKSVGHRFRFDVFENNEMTFYSRKRKQQDIKQGNYIKSPDSCNDTRHNDRISIWP